MGSDGQSGAAGLQFGESERFVEEAKFEPERPLIEIHDGGDLVDVENCPPNCIVILSVAPDAAALTHALRGLPLSSSTSNESIRPAWGTSACEPRRLSCRREGRRFMHVAVPIFTALKNYSIKTRLSNSG